jgi:hypothetical protein
MLTLLLSEQERTAPGSGWAKLTALTRAALADSRRRYANPLLVDLSLYRFTHIHDHLQMLESPCTQVWRSG